MIYRATARPQGTGCGKIRFRTWDSLDSTQSRKEEFKDEERRWNDPFSVDPEKKQFSTH
jgi:hypothetical protein